MGGTVQANGKEKSMLDSIALSKIILFTATSAKTGSQTVKGSSAGLAI
jgi:hypothetical protein